LGVAIARGKSTNNAIENAKQVSSCIEVLY
jgi:formate-dependent phosphoribosylglycinamide formyltransferase (GAR transformylase)